MTLDDNDDDDDGDDVDDFRQSVCVVDGVYSACEQRLEPSDLHYNNPLIPAPCAVSLQGERTTQERPQPTLSL